MKNLNKKMLVLIAIILTLCSLPYYTYSMESGEAREGSGAQGLPPEIVRPEREMIDLQIELDDSGLPAAQQLPLRSLNIQVPLNDIGIKIQDIKSAINTVFSNAGLFATKIIFLTVGFWEKLEGTISQDEIEHGEIWAILDSYQPKTERHRKNIRIN